MTMVIVVIGLGIGGIFVGKDLMRAAEIRSQISQIEEYKAAVNTFKLKYNALPGDISPVDTAQLGFFTFTGSKKGQCYSFFVDTTIGYYYFCYGNNNGRIEEGEWLAFWQHLSQAKLITGQYGGSISASNYIQDNTFPTLNGGKPFSTIMNQRQKDLFQPQSKFNNADNHIYLGNNFYYSQYPYFTNSSLQHIFYFYATPNQEYSIDTKIDDGLPDKGKVRDSGTNFGAIGASPCVTAATFNEYDVKSSPDKSDACQLYIGW